MKLPRAGKLGKFMIYAPIALEVVSYFRQQQKNTRHGKYTKARKRDRAFDFLLNQARRKLCQKKSVRH